MCNAPIQYYSDEDMDYKLTGFEFRSWKRAYISEEALIQQLKELKRCIMDRSAGTSRIH